MITITDPVCVDYHWVGDWEPTFPPPLHEHAARNTTISPANPSQQEVNTENVKLKFDGWYRLWNNSVDHEEDGKKTWNYNGQKYVSYQNTIYASFGSDLQLYGRWVPFIDVNFHWIGSVITEGLDEPSSVSLSLGDAGGCLYQAETPTLDGYEFDGWYDDKDAGKLIDFDTEKFDGAKTVYVHWAKNATVTFKIVNGYWSGETAEDRNVTVVLYPRADGSVGGTLPASSVPAIMIPAAGYENAAGSWDAAPNIEPNGIVDSVTYTYTFGRTHSGGSTSTKLTLHYESKGGTSYRDERYSSGTIVNLDKIPIRGGYTFSSWYADAGLTAPITNVRMTENKTVYAGWEATAVPDMLDGTGHYIYAVGYADGTIRPNANISRAEVAAISFRLLKSDIRDKNVTTSNTFEDVQSGQWFNTAVSTMEKLGVVKGRSAEFFDPDAPITRAEFSVICASFDRRQINGSTSFSDLSGHWAEKSIERAAALGWIAGYEDDTFRPNHYITRAEAMTMINRVLCRVPETEGDLLPGMITWPDNQPGTWYYLAVQEATNSHDYDRKDAIHEKWTALTEEPDWKYDLAQ